MDTLRGALLASNLLLAFMAGPAAAAPVEPATGTVTLVWTAPGDDGFEGVAAQYDLRYSLAPITAENFDHADRARHIPPPGVAGLHQRARVTGLEANHLYYFALKAADEAGNWSLLSNVAFRTAPDPSTLAAVDDIALSAPYPSPSRNNIHVAFTLPAEAFAHIKVFDVGGREVKTLAYDRYRAGTTTLQWDLRDEAGARLGIGQYWIKALLGNRTLTRRLVVVP